jgi:hypothetical protein
MPEVEQNPNRRLKLILDDPQDLRTEFLRLPHNVRAALKFLNKIGVWSAWTVKSITSKGVRDGTVIPEMRLDGSFGYRYLRELAVLPMSLDRLWDEQKYWRELLCNNWALLRMKFRSLPSEDASTSEKMQFAISTEFGNTLPMHLEWKVGPSQYPRAIIQPMTGQEFLIATAWLDIVTQQKSQICQRSDCGCPFTGRLQKYCSDSCAHLVAVRAYRDRKRKARLARHAGKRKARKSLR